LEDSLGLTACLFGELDLSGEISAILCREFEKGKARDNSELGTSLRTVHYNSEKRLKKSILRPFSKQVLYLH